MTAHSTFGNKGFRTLGDSSHLLSLCETSWGYTIRSDTQVARRAVLIERMSGFAGIACLAVACGSWLVPEVQAAVLGGVSAKMASSIGMAIPALLLLWICDRGMTQEVQVDVVKGCLRLTVCNRNGKSRVLRKIGFDTIASAFVKKNPGHGDSAQLFVRGAKGGAPFAIANGRESTLRLLHDRLSQELRPSRTKLPGWERVGRRLKPSAV